MANKNFMMSQIQRWVSGTMVALVCLLNLSTDVYAQTKGYEEFPYSELFTEGKEWTMYHFTVSPSGFRNHYIITVKVDGSKNIEGIDCKRLTINLQNFNGSCYVCENWLDRSLANDIGQLFYGLDVAIPEEVYVYEKDRKIYYYKNPGVKIKSDESGLYGCDPYFALYMDLNRTI